MKGGSITLCILGIATLCQSCGSVGAQDFNPGGLERKVSSYQVHNASIVEALRQLKLRGAENHLIFTLEVVPFLEKPENNLSLALQELTVREVLEQIMEQDPRYTYELIDSRLVHVFPRAAKDDAEDLLNVKVEHFAVSAAAYDLLLKYPNYHIPQLEAEIMRRGKYGGVVGHMMGGVDVPRITISLQDVTVRDILNRVAQETEGFSKEHHGPTGWVYTFRIDKSLPLGGQPRWDLF